jgi:hypothetical protein
MSALLELDGPSQWAEFSIYDSIHARGEDPLNQAVVVLNALNSVISAYPAHTPLINQGRWLKDFLRPLPTRYATWVHRLLNPARSFSFPERFVSLANRVNSIARPKETEFDVLFNKALNLPGDLLRLEVDSPFWDELLIHPLVTAVEKAVASYLGVLEEIAIMSEHREELFFLSSAISKILNDFASLGPDGEYQEFLEHVNAYTKFTAQLVDRIINQNE